MIYYQLASDEDGVFWLLLIVISFVGDKAQLKYPSFSPLTF